MGTSRDIRYYPLLLVLAVLFLMSLACAGTTSTSEPQINTATPEKSEPKISTATPEKVEQKQPTETQRSQVKLSDTPEPTTSPIVTPTPEPQFLGDVFGQYGYYLSAIRVEDPATPGMFYKPVSGNKLVAVEVIIGVSSGDPINLNPLGALLLDSEGFTYQPELVGQDIQLMTELFQGEKIRGVISFSIPEKAIPASIKYSIELFGDKVLKASLEKAPAGHVPSNIEVLSVSPPVPESKLGDTVEQYGYSLAALAVEDPALPGTFTQPKNGYKLVAIEIALGNISGDTLSVNPLFTVLVDTNGYVYKPELAVGDEQLAPLDINPGEKIRGWVTFMIPEDASPYIIKYQLTMFSYQYLSSGLSK